MADEFKRGDAATVRATGRDVQVHPVSKMPDGKTLLECKALSGVPHDDGNYRPSELNRCIRLAPVLPPEQK
jgi:hypothetical protein